MFNSVCDVLKTKIKFLSSLCDVMVLSRKSDLYRAAHPFVFVFLTFFSRLRCFSGHSSNDMYDLPSGKLANLYKK